MDEPLYEEFLRNRITELRLRKNVSEHRMSLDLGKSGSYIRSITSGTAMPSVKELFNIIIYFGITPLEFFAGCGNENSPRMSLIDKLQKLDNEDLEKVILFIQWIEK
ncbi:MAG: helix-turn-helix transcriptional regulator [Eubacteriales bacterium]|nr:helix-turn-helix transcriptional regulator [Eubacteriales bacterium]